jgi:hypothetical protein
MPPRRTDRQTLDPPEEREMLRRRGRQMTDPVMEKEMCDLRARLEDMETTQRCTVNVGDISDFESEIEDEHEEEVAAEEQQTNASLELLQEWVLKNSTS